MKRLVVIVGAAVAAVGIAAAPALAGLKGNPSFSQQIPVPAPSQAKQPSIPADDHGGLIRHSEPGDDRGASPEVEPGDDRGGATAGVEPGDDRGGATPQAEPGDDHGGLTPNAEPGDDRGGSGGGSTSGGRS